MKNLIYAIIFFVFGIYFVITPYEKIQARLPKVKSPKTIKMVGGFLIGVGIFMILLMVLSAFI